MSRPTNTIKNIKNSKKKKRAKFKEKTNELKDKINGNPQVIEAIRMLEKRIELIENERN